MLKSHHEWDIFAEDNHYDSLQHYMGPIYTAWISNHMPSKVWDEITYPFPNFNIATTEVWVWINDFISHFIMDVWWM